MLASYLWLRADPVTAFLLAAIMTWLFHSSVAAVLLVVALAARGILPLELGVVLVLGAGIVGTGAALIGRDTWRFTNLVLVCSLVAYVIGLVLNYKYLRGRFFGPTRGQTMSRRAADSVEPEPPAKMRVR